MPRLPAVMPTSPCGTFQLQPIELLAHCGPNIRNRIGDQLLMNAKEFHGESQARIDNGASLGSEKELAKNRPKSSALSQCSRPTASFTERGWATLNGHRKSYFRG